MLKAKKNVKSKSNGKLWKSLPLKLNCDLSPKLMFAHANFRVRTEFGQFANISELGFLISFRPILLSSSTIMLETCLCSGVRIVKYFVDFH